MTLPFLQIADGPSEYAVEIAFVGRRTGAYATFTVIANNERMTVRLQILNFEFVTCHGAVYKLGGTLRNMSMDERAKLPKHNFVFVQYDARHKMGSVQFSNAE